MSRVLRCWHCKVVIGRHEPIVAVVDGQARTISRARELDDEQPGECYHLACYERAYSQTRDA